MVIINYLVYGHEPKITFKDNCIDFDVNKFDVISTIRNSGQNCSTETYKEFQGVVTVTLGLDDVYQLTLTKT